MTAMTDEERAQRQLELGRQLVRLNGELQDLWVRCHPRTPNQKDIERIENRIGLVLSEQQTLAKSITEGDGTSKPESRPDSYMEVQKRLYEQQNRPPERAPLQRLEGQVTALTRTVQQLAARVEELEQRATKPAT